MKYMYHNYVGKFLLPVFEYHAEKQTLLILK